MKKKMLAVLMAACVMTTMSGCGNSSNTGTETTSDAETGSAETTAQEETTAEDTAAAAERHLAVCTDIEKQPLAGALRHSCGE